MAISAIVTSEPRAWIKKDAEKQDLCVEIMRVKMTFSVHNHDDGFSFLLKNIHKDKLCIYVKVT